MGEKVDFKKTLDVYQARRGELRMVDVPPTQYLMIDGHGDPNTSPKFAEAVTALYPVAYAMKFGSARELERDYVVPPLEGLWWAEDMATFTTARDKTRWDWTLLLRVPDWLGRVSFTAAVARVGGRSGRSPTPVRLGDVRLESLHEGRCVQTLHVGSFDDEAAVLAHLHDEFVPRHGLRPTGTHHEIYLSDRRRVAPHRQRTLLRQPVLDAASP